MERMSLHNARSGPALDRLFNPDSIAIVGASNSAGKMGNLFTLRLKECFGGQIYPINPAEREVVGLPSYPLLADVPGEVDLVLALLPGTALVDLIERSPPGKARFIAAIPSGFAEASDSGRQLQQRLQAAAGAMGAQLIGPNIVGVMNCEIGLNASMMPVMPPGGKGISCVTQSGGVGMALTMYALDHNLAVAKFCDLGNSAGLSIDTVLDYYAADPSTRLVMLFLEAVQDKNDFFDRLGAAARKKPTILTALGRSEAGRRASLAHLGIDAPAFRLPDELPENVVYAETAQDLFDAGKAILWQSRAAARRLAVITGTGGIGAEIADLAVSRGLDLPEFSPDLQIRLKAGLPDFAGVRNPVDVTPIWWRYHEIYPELATILDQSQEVDQVLLSITDVATTLPEIVAALVELKPRLTKPVTVFWGSRNQDLGPMARLQEAGYPCFGSTRSAVNAAVAVASSDSAYA